MKYKILSKSERVKVQYNLEDRKEVWESFPNEEWNLVTDNPIPIRDAQSMKVNPNIRIAIFEKELEL